MGDSSPNITLQDDTASLWKPVYGDDQEVAATRSRHAQPRAWARAAHWLIDNAALNARTAATLHRIVAVLQSGMDYSTGHVLYSLDTVATALRINRATVKRRVAQLREMGLLAWVRHGSKRNSRADRGLPGYAGTATIYAATIPPVYDHAMGHTVIGDGYDARIVIDQRGQQKAVEEPVDNPPTKIECAPFPHLVKYDGPVDVDGGVVTTGGAGAKTSTTPSKKPSNQPRRKRRTILGAVVTATGIQRGARIARVLAARFPWLRKASYYQIRWVCADMGERGWTVQQAIAFASEAASCRGAAGVLWDPDRPHAVLAAHLRAREEQHQTDVQAAPDQARAVPAMQNAEWRAYQERKASEQQALADMLAGARTDLDRQRAQQDGWNDWTEVADHYDEDPDDALDLYGERLCTYAVRRSAQTASRQGALL
ncbi:hypothetical protein ACFV3R_25575 [Streptomyces sp. NPDC059740]|uniref:hypothetical protein n=1 Tax=Streptomyces sp. NPDC059740 TaxID=3346926 RepID=UPI0036523DD8